MYKTVILCCDQYPTPLQFGAHDQDYKSGGTGGGSVRREVRRERRRREPGDGPGGDDYQTVSHPGGPSGYADVVTVPAPQTQPGPLRWNCDTVVAASVLCGAVSANLPNFFCDFDDYVTSIVRTILTMTSRMSWIVILMCMIVLTQVILLHRLMWNLCMNYMDQITVGSIVSCGMRSDHMDIMHQRTLSFPMACMTRRTMIWGPGRSPRSSGIRQISSVTLILGPGGGGLAVVGSWLVHAELSWCRRCVAGAELREFR